MRMKHPRLLSRILNTSVLCSVLMTTTLDGKIKARLPSQTADLREPVWGPYGR